MGLSSGLAGLGVLCVLWAKRVALPAKVDPVFGESHGGLSAVLAACRFCGWIVSYRPTPNQAIKPNAGGVSFAFHGSLARGLSCC